MKRFVAVLMTVILLLGMTAVMASAEDAKAEKSDLLGGYVDIPMILETAFPGMTDVIEFFSPVLRVPMFAYALLVFLGSVLADIFI